ncbi:PcsB-like coiled-coil domain-containing protein [Blautia difficilis]|uniref:Peptidoglycan hydrolase PcsB coiled-coil domain-containing protein n=1 Tax=Blautia difficilis TaxID=2763027 RepID=A0ABR7IGT7_9FIRM|nr:hypothetical protein [Blautia difficilis]MBC5779236.1 hypothetical protein [Blautia difficilis]
MKKKIISLLLAGLFVLSNITVTYATEGEIADMQAQKQQAEAGLAQAQADISAMEGKKQELEDYLSDLNAQYEELTNVISDLSVQAGEKENQLKDIQKKLKKAQKASDKQYEDMKLRIQYMYENGGTTALQTLLSSKDLAEFLNTAESVSKISQYDRTMLNKYEKLQETIKEQKTAAQEEKTAIDNLLAERSAKQQEVQELAASTSDNISSYIAQISASQEEAAALTAQINSADNSIAQLIQQAEAEKAAQERAEAEAAAAEEASGEEDTTEEDAAEDTADYEEDTTEENDAEENYESQDSGEDTSDTEESSENTEDSSDASENQSSSESTNSGQGKYLGNFTLTAYCNCAQCCGTAGNLTASGTVPTAGRTVAMAGVPFGTQLLINGNVYTVEDLGTPYGHVDIFFDNHSDALSFGLQSAEVYQLN